MSPYMDRIVARLRHAEDDLRRDVEAQQQQWHYTVHRRRVRFDRRLRDGHRRLKLSVAAYIRHGSVTSLFTAPVIYSLVGPLLLLDLWVTLYQWICFPIYGVARVSRAQYFVVDRHNLAYLNGIEKLHCTYCSYANGVIGYTREIAARTEQYWCPIKHSRIIPASHERYHLFFDYGDASSYRRALPTLRGALVHARRRACEGKRHGQPAGRVRSGGRR